jgi:excisionase family DNA binding protein
VLRPLAKGHSIKTATPNVKSTLTPKELADAIGASESSLRRWVDSGDIRISRTAGGHRRIPLPEAIQFIRKIGATVVRPDLIGLPPARGSGGSSSNAAVRGAGLLDLADDEKLFESLRAGDRKLAKALILSWYLEGQSLPALFDGPLRGALRRLGELWQHDKRGILIEHQATVFCLEAIAVIRGLLPSAEDRALLALGGAPQGDPYLLPTMMAAAVLADEGFRDVDFGANTPVELLAKEAIDRGASLVWLSISALDEPKLRTAAIKRLAGTLAKHRVELVLGGRRAAECAPRDAPNVTLIASMSELAGFARGMKAKS